ncbi:MAG: division/cell wall cluster transcriptional repressor MraZ [Patescibacteria group bacterium]|nr:division/cell wall cluster transcriptional repressor MraZ [Patescibacteria group bacterium]
MFIGEYHHNIDDKGRVAIPVKFRAQLKQGAVVTKGLDNCLFLYPKEEFAEEAKKYAQLPKSQAKARAYARHMLAGAMDLNLDSQGRVMLPEYLRNFSGMKKKLVVAGLYDRLELWDEDKWNNYKESSEKESNSIAEGLGEFGV